MNTPFKIIIGMITVVVVVMIALPSKPLKTIDTFEQLSKDCGNSEMFIDRPKQVVHCETEDFELQITLDTYSKYQEKQRELKEFAKRKANPHQPDKRRGISPAQAKITVLQMCRLNGVLTDNYLQDEFYGVARRTGTELVRIFVWADMAKQDYKNLYEFERKRYTGSICHW